MHAAVLKGHYIYAFGGFTRGMLTFIERYSIMDITWEPVPDMPVGRYGHCALAPFSDSTVMHVSKFWEAFILALLKFLTQYYFDGELKIIYMTCRR